MGLFIKQCEYCKEKIDKGKGVVAEVKVPEFARKKELFYKFN